ncbi:LOW QUALITY PROTEIN: TBC1 domain family member 5-like, partial [Manduca sexta]|uniref:LOW QUALITY PROTEIN: TBC1 domain family member 5-like n=1 Tax=Manduca sexta TaxID=7130 RepID=UPI00188F030B
MDQDSTDSSSSPSNNGSDCVDFELELPTWSLEQLKKAAIQLRLMRPRSLAWAILLNALPPLNGDIITSIKTHRNFYNDLKLKLSMDPRTVIGDDPLSQNDESVWKQHFCDNELKTLILQDVVRTFPDELYFRDKDVQDTMVRVLFFWARSHSNVGYRQGMHEVLAPLLFELYLDRKFAPNDISDKLKIILDEEYLEHDSFMLFSAVLKGLEKFYVTGEVAPSATGRMPSARTIHNPNEVIKYLERVKVDYLLPIDYELVSFLDQCNISMELFGIRWLRLLFGREFPRSELPHLWGFLFCDGPMLPNLHYVIVAMLVSIRNTLLSAGGGGALCALMRPLWLSAAHVAALALHLRAPHDHHA